jgi:hypothetical protein
MVGIPGSQDREAPAAAWGRFCETVLAEIKQKNDLVKFKFVIIA